MSPGNSSQQTKSAIMKITRTRLVTVALAASLLLTSCGGSSGSSGNDPMVNTPPPPTTGFIALLFTDRASDDFSAIRLNVREAILIGGDAVDGQQVLFQGDEPIDLLDLTNFSEPIIFGEVEPGVYTKLRLIIDNLELVPLDGGPSQFPPLPANGRIDMLDPGGIEILPGRTLLAEIDMEANKAIHIVGAGNSGRYRFRPVVKANFWDGDAGEFPDKLTRVEGTASGIDPSGTFTLCDIETPDSCIDVATNVDTSIFGPDGTPVDFDTLMDTDPVTVIGRYAVDGGIVIIAALLEIGGNAELIAGQVVSDPVDNQFLLLRGDDTDIVVSLQDGTLYYDETGVLGPEAIVLGASLSVEGVVDADLVRAALVFVEAEEDAQLSGTIAEIPEGSTDSFVLTTDSGDVTVTLVEGADILLVDVAASEVTMGAFENLYAGQVVDLFGTDVSTETENLFDANEVIVDVNASPPPPAP
jgi:hypothetical protein